MVVPCVRACVQRCDPAAARPRRRHLYKQYMLGYTYYKINNVDCRISNPDQLLTNDCKQFCQSVTDLFQNTLKPLLDMTVFARCARRACVHVCPSVCLAGWQAGRASCLHAHACLLVCVCVPACVCMCCCVHIST